MPNLFPSASSGYRMTNGRWAAVAAITLADSALRSSNSASSALEVGTATVANLTLTVTAKAGTNPTLDVVIQTSVDGSTWRTVAAFTQATDVTAERKSFSGLDRYTRASWTIGGTSSPSFTFSLAGDVK